MEGVLAGLRIQDNVIVTLTDVDTGEQTVISTHNKELNYSLSAISQWLAGKNNVGYQPVNPPTKCSFGSGTGTPATGDTGLYTAIPGATVSMSYANANTPSNGTTTFYFQFPAGQITSQVTEALMTDINGNPWFHTMFPSPFTPAANQNVGIQWLVTLS